MSKKVPVSALLRRADEVATIAGITREEAIQALKVAHERLGYEVDLGSPATDGVELNFANGRHDLSKTQVLPNGFAARY